MINAWQELNDVEYSAVWDRFYAQFDFTPSVHAEKWPGISEPTPSETYNVSKAYDGEESHDNKLVSELQLWGLNAFQDLLLSDPGWLYALDWQHSCYRFTPRVPFDLDEFGEWVIPLFPDGDYSIFLEKEFNWGVFGHPWEQTMCVFGDPLLAILKRERPDLLTSLVRRNGQSV